MAKNKIEEYWDSYIRELKNKGKEAINSFSGSDDSLGKILYHSFQGAHKKIIKKFDDKIAELEEERVNLIERAKNEIEKKTQEEFNQKKQELKGLRKQKESKKKEIKNLADEIKNIDAKLQNIGKIRMQHGNINQFLFDLAELKGAFQNNQNRPIELEKNFWDNFKKIEGYRADILDEKWKEYSIDGKNLETYEKDITERLAKLGTQNESELNKQILDKNLSNLSMFLTKKLEGLTNKLKNGGELDSDLLWKKKDNLNNEIKELEKNNPAILKNLDKKIKELEPYETNSRYDSILKEAIETKSQEIEKKIKENLENFKTKEMPGFYREMKEEFKNNAFGKTIDYLIEGVGREIEVYSKDKKDEKKLKALTSKIQQNLNDLTGTDISKEEQTELNTALQASVILEKDKKKGIIGAIKKFFTKIFQPEKYRKRKEEKVKIRAQRLNVAIKEKFTTRGRI